jgi:hypothetical protein
MRRPADSSANGRDARGGTADALAALTTARANRCYLASGSRNFPMMVVAPITLGAIFVISWP